MIKVQYTENVQLGEQAHPHDEVRRRRRRRVPAITTCKASYGRVYFVSVDYNLITVLTLETFLQQKFNLCGRRHRGGGPPGGGARDGDSRPPTTAATATQIEFFLVLNFWVPKFWFEIGPNGAQTDP